MIVDSRLCKWGFSSLQHWRSPLFRSSRITRRKRQGRGAVPFIRLTFRTAFFFGWAAAAGLALVLPYVNEMLFETRDGSVALIIFSLQIFWLSLIFPLTAILQGAGKVKIPTLFLMGVGNKNYCESTIRSNIGCHRGGDCGQYRLC